MESNQIRALWVAVKALQKRLTAAAGGVAPSAHATSHSAGGSDPIDVTDLDGFPGGSPILYLDSNGDFTSPDIVGELPPVYHGNSGAALTLDWSVSRKHVFTLNNDPALTLDNPVDGGAYVVVIDGGAGTFSPTWPANVRWPSDTAPDTTAAAISVLVTLLYREDSDHYLGSFNSPYDLT